MDELVYVAMNGARQLERAQAITSHNLANASTVGFRAELHGFEDVDITGPGFESRVNTAVTHGGYSSAKGSNIATGNEMDVAVNGSGWLAVQAPDGSEAYTKAGDLRVTALGMITNGRGLPVMGDAGSPLSVPPYSSLTIGNDGTVSIVPKGQGAQSIATVGRLKLVDPPAADLEKGVDGLIRMKDGSEALPDADVSVTTGVLEGSNVNVVDALVTMIGISRQYEMQIKLIDSASENAQAAASMMSLS